MRRLRHFLAVCDHGGFSRAAMAVGLAQPALTRQVQLLEQELGVALFTRNGRGALPTEAGHLLMSEARTHLDRLDQVVDRLRRDFTEGPLRLTMGICPTIAPLFLSQVQEALRHLPGAPALSVIEAYSGDLRRLMAAGRLNFALSYGLTGDPVVQDLPLLSERLVVATRQSDHLHPPLSLAQLAGLKLILPSRNHQLRRIIDAVCAARGQALTPALELDSLSALRAMLEDDGFSTILPYHAAVAEAEGAALDTVAIDDPAMVRQIALLYPGAAPDLLPELTGAIRARADEIRRTMEAVS